MTKVAISAVIIAKNEAGRLTETLQALQWCDEIILIDSFSEDKTTQIAEQYGAKVFQQVFLGYGVQKNFGFSKASNSWVLSVDADEIISKELADEITMVFENGVEGVTAFYLPRKHIFLGKLFKYGKESRDFLPRLFNKNFAQYDNALVHESLMIKGKTKRLVNPMFHNTYTSLEHAKIKMDAYAKLGALKLHQNSISRNVMMVYLAFPFYLFKHYILYLNILNGIAGLKWSWLIANYHFRKYYYLNKKLF